MATMPTQRGPHEEAGKAQQVASEVQDKAQEAKSRASDKVRTELDARSTQMGQQATSLAQALRKAGEHLQTEGNGNGSKAVHKVADQVERLGSYLTESDSDRFLGDAEQFGRRRPWAAGAIGAVAGFLASRFMKASSENRYRSSTQTSVDADRAISRDVYSTEQF